jgi:hypothetical protein
MSSTPYDNKILLVNWLGRNTPGRTPTDTAALLRSKMPNVSGIMLKVTNGTQWQGELTGDDGAKEITGVARIAQWVEAFAAHDLEIHVWGVPRAANRPAAAEEHSPDIPQETEKLIAAAKVSGVKSLLLDVEKDPPNAQRHFYWQGTPGEVVQYMTLLRQGLGPDYHIGMILDGRRNRSFAYYVDPWIPTIDSLHPMVYPILFGNHRTIEEHLDDSFRNLGGYGRPVVPMLQAFGEAGSRPTPEQITRQGNSAWTRGAAGISFFRLGNDLWRDDNLPHMGEPEYKAVSAIYIPGQKEAAAFTWQDLINAVTTVANRHSASWSSWFSQAGLWDIFHNSLRTEPYHGPALNQWPLSAELRQEIAKLLELDSRTLATITAESQRRRDRLEREIAAARRRERGGLIGIHGAPGLAAPPVHLWDKWITYLKEMGVRWYKQVETGDPQDTGSNTIFAWCKRLKQEGIEPIVRFYRQQQFPDSLPDPYFEKMALFAAEGIVWVEIGNEPNLDYEWQPQWHNRDGRNEMRHSNHQVIRLLAETWLRDARRALDAGVRPAFYAMAPTDWRGNYHPVYSSVFFTRRLVAYLAQSHYQETVELFRRGAWIAVHTATYEQGPEFDPIRPDNTVWDMCLRGYEVVLQAFRTHFRRDLDLDQVVIMSTEGGVFTPDSLSMGEHRPRLRSDVEHGQKTVEMFRWLERHSPLQAMCPWCLSVGPSIGHSDPRFQYDGWFEDVNGQIVPRAVYEAMRQLRFDHEREDEQADPSRTTVKLDVPFLSQYDPTASSRSADCGPTCLAMILNAQRPADQHVTVDALYERHLPHKGFREFTSIGELIQVSEAEGMKAFRKTFDVDPLSSLREFLRRNIPVITLVNYDKWADIVGYNFRSGHFVVVTGFDDNHIFVHDPLFRGARRHEGEFFVWRNERFLKGWGSGREINNPNFAAVIPYKQVPRL